MDALLIDALVNLEQHVTGFNLIKILNLHLGDITVDLQADKRGLPAHVGVIGKLAFTGKRRQSPGVENNQYANDANGGGGENRDDANIISGVGLLFGRILLTHNDSRVNFICYPSRVSARCGR